MTLLHVNLARSTWLLPTRDLNPYGLDLFPVFNAIRQRYGFQRLPKPEDTIEGPNGVKFGGGAFKLSDGRQIEIESLGIFPDGLVAETRHSTAATDDFLSDLFAFGAKKWGLASDPTLVRERGYLSVLKVTSDIDLAAFSEKLVRISAALTEYTGKQFVPATIRFGVSPAAPPSLPDFIFEYERVPFDRKRYYTEAPLGTDEHLALLERIESILGSQ